MPVCALCCIRHVPKRTFSPSRALSRLGTNFHQLAVNKPRCPALSITQRDGFGAYDNNGGNLPNYFPNSFLVAGTQPRCLEHVDTNVCGDVSRFDTSNDDNFTQVTDFYEKVLSREEKQRLADNIAGHVKNAAVVIQRRVVANFTQVHADLGAAIRAGLVRFGSEV